MLGWAGAGGGAENWGLGLGPGSAGLDWLGWDGDGVGRGQEFATGT